MAKTAFITGITGQDGSYLAEFLLANGYEVHGLIRRASTFNTSRLDHIYQDPHDPHPRLRLHYGDLTDGSMLARLLAKIQPDEVYNFGAQTHVAVSFEMPEYTTNATAVGALRLLESVREADVRPRIYQASSSEMFGSSPPPQGELTPFDPLSPYAAAKVFAHHVAGMYRSAYELFIARGILFNHESPRRGPTFVTRKITLAVARICAGKDNKVYLGNLDARRDWGYAPEYVEGAWMMLQADEPGDFVLATGRSTSVKDFAKCAFELVGLNWEEHVEIDPRYLRPLDVPDLIGDATTAREALGWAARVDPRSLAQIMLQADLAQEGLDPRQFLKERLLPDRPEWAQTP